MATGATVDPRERYAGWVAPLCWLAVALEGFDLVVLGVVLPALLKEPGWGLTPNTASLVSVVGLVGVMVGALTVGTISDYIGRRQTMLWTVISFSLLTLLVRLRAEPVDLRPAPVPRRARARRRAADGARADQRVRDARPRRHRDHQHDDRLPRRRRAHRAARHHHHRAARLALDVRRRRAARAGAGAADVALPARSPRRSCACAPGSPTAPPRRARPPRSQPGQHAVPPRTGPVDDRVLGHLVHGPAAGLRPEHLAAADHEVRGLPARRRAGAAAGAQRRWRRRACWSPAGCPTGSATAAPPSSGSPPRRCSWRCSASSCPASGSTSACSWPACSCSAPRCSSTPTSATSTRPRRAAPRWARRAVSAAPGRSPAR